MVYLYYISYCYLHGENKKIKEKLDLMFVYLRFKTYKHTSRVFFILRKFIYTFKYQCPTYQSMLHFINVLNFPWIQIICDSGKVSTICSRPVNVQNQRMIKAILGHDTQVSVRFHNVFSAVRRKSAHLGYEWLVTLGKVSRESNPQRTDIHPEVGHFRKSNTDTVNVDGSQRLFLWYNVKTSAVCIVLSETFRGIHVPRTKRWTHQKVWMLL